jgi:hypothetical protein
VGLVVLLLLGRLVGIEELLLWGWAVLERKGWGKNEWRERVVWEDGWWPQEKKLGGCRMTATSASWLGCSGTCNLNL